MAMTRAQIESLIQRVELFNGLTHEEVEKIFAHGLTMAFRKDDVLFYRDTVGNQMFVVLGGKVGVYGDGDKCLATLGTGDMFGEMALVTHERRSATVRALDDGYVFVLNEITFYRLLTKKVAIQILLNMVRTLSRRLKEANARPGE
ncbi:MAG TPA: cyclic nucleotide-binding domain-containing protein [Candidatus Hydrogenedentes bacterium]|nr:cyclic nucleotide-binding domain-containing protein [Candidatus Hydrogenedentota bacterium]HNT88307.1 cyclic nucleotide-binding domain-containing protein [Candidatus Hydrogenedentota bacterium]